MTVRAAYVYANPRAKLARDVAVGLAPDTGLLQNHLSPLGTEATIHDPALTRRERRGVAHRPTTRHLAERPAPFLREAAGG